MLRARQFVPLFTLFGYVVSGCSTEITEPVQPGPSGLEGDIGPEGGVLAGTEADFAGVRVEVPQGALDKPAHIAIRPALDSTPLPLLAESVGQQFLIDGGGAALNKPIAVTLPFDPSLVSTFNQFPGDVKVWIEADGEMKLVDAKAATDTTVTVDLDRFTTAGAGIKDLPRLTLGCGDHCIVPVPRTTCTTGADHFDVALTQADPSSDEYKGRIGRAIRAMFDGSIVILTANGELLRLYR